jgi:hypothetical protein
MRLTRAQSPPTDGGEGTTGDPTAADGDEPFAI